MKKFNFVILLLLLSLTTFAQAPSNTLFISLTSEKNPDSNNNGDHPTSTIKLSLKGAIEKTEILAKTIGHCSDITSSGNWEKPKNSLVGYMCWWAGSGDQFVIDHIKNTLVIKTRGIDSEAGEQPYRTIKTIVIPAGVKKVEVKK